MKSIYAYEAFSMTQDRFQEILFAFSRSRRRAQPDNERLHYTQLESCLSRQVL